MESADIRCPYLYGNELEGGTYFRYPSSGNCCSRMRPETRGILFWKREVPPYVVVEHQEKFCLTADHARCTLYVPPDGERESRGAGVEAS